MNILSRSPYRRWFLLGLFVQVVTAWCSVGYHHPDEHFQVLEFSNYKMGFSPAADLPWEFAAQCRTGVQPFIAFCLSKMLYACHLYNPFFVAFLLRLLIGVASWWVICKLVILLLPEFVTGQGKMFFVWCSMLLWFVPYLGVRFSAENFSGTVFLAALFILLQLLHKEDGQRRIFRLIIAGLFLGFSFFVRPQMAFAIAGLIIWLLFIQKWPWKEWLLIALSSFIAIGISVVIDHWLYGVWILSPVNYFYFNVTKNVAATFGTAPWWWYFTYFITASVLPLGIVLLLFFLSGLRFKPLHLLSLVAVAFIIGHCAIGHKEIRFLFPMVFPLIFLSSVGIDRFIHRFTYSRLVSRSLNVLIVINIALLAYRSLAPAQEAVKYYAFLYKKLPQPNTAIINNPYILAGLNANFYKPANAHILIAKDSSEIKEVIDKNNYQDVYYFSTSLIPDIKPAGYQMKKAYCLLPEWVLQHNINDWESRSNIWAIYKLQAH